MQRIAVRCRRPLRPIFSPFSSASDWLKSSFLTSESENRDNVCLSKRPEERHLGNDFSRGRLKQPFCTVYSESISHSLDGLFSESIQFRVQSITRKQSLDLRNEPRRKVFVNSKVRPRVCIADAYSRPSARTTEWKTTSKALAREQEGG